MVFRYNLCMSEVLRLLGNTAKYYSRNRNHRRMVIAAAVVGRIALYLKYVEWSVRDFAQIQ